MSESALDQVLTQRRSAQEAVVNVEEESTKLVVFALGAQRYAFAGSSVAEVLGTRRIFAVPGCPPSLVGVINVRGEIESVIRLNELLGVALDGARTDTPILLGRGRTLRSGILVDRVIDVVDVLVSNILPPPSTLSAHLKGLVTGAVELAGDTVTLLDLDQVFSHYSAGSG
jgi:purine-binding chemotaxis protein CheW